MRDPIAFAKRVCTVAGWYGVLTLTPLLFMEAQFGTATSPTSSRPIFYFGFVAVSLAWQIAFLTLGKAPLVNRELLIPAAFSKLAFAIAIVALITAGRAPNILLLPGCIELAFAAGFLVSYYQLRDLTM